MKALAGDVFGLCTLANLYLVGQDQVGSSDFDLLRMDWLLLLDLQLLQRKDQQSQAPNHQSL